MKKELLELIHCPVCRGENLVLQANYDNKVEVREGHVECRDCRRTFEISEGILNLLVDPSAEIINEQQGWTILEKAVVNTDELMLSLPDAIGEHVPAWQYQASNFHYMWSQLQLTGKEQVLDLGSGRCWSTRYFARAGCSAVGIDILLTKYVGLRTADIFMNHDNTYFERVCGSMNKVPFRDAMFDIVFVAATMHHSSNLAMTTKEIARVLKPGGQAIIINEPVVGVFQSKKLDCPECDHGINEHVYRLWEYLFELRRQGMTYRVYPFIGSYRNFVSCLNLWLVRRFPAQLMPQRVWSPLLFTQLVVFGGGLNLMARKPNG